MNQTERSYIHKEYSDIMELNGETNRWNLEFRKLDKQEFFGAISVVDIEIIQVAKIILKGTIKHYGHSPKGYRTFVVPTKDTNNYYWLNRKIENNKLLVFPETNIFHAISHNYFEVYTISIREDHLKKIIDQHKFTNFHNNLTPPESAYIVNKNFTFYIQSFLEIVFSRLNNDPDAVNCASLFRKLKHRIPYMLCGFLDRKKITNIPPLNRKRDIAFNKAISFIDNQIDQTICMDELCKHTNVSERTLEYSFNERLGISPTTYINYLRLNLVRQNLLTKKKGELISDIAKRFNFKHMGQFASDYSRLFHELPSETEVFNEESVLYLG